jgi:hypothetical protein
LLVIDNFTIVQIAVAVLLGNIMTRVLFRGWDRLKTRPNPFDFKTALFYLAPLGLIVLVLVGSTAP